jgi:hypothetical protein
MINENQFNAEIYGFDTAIALAELEKDKASERVSELRYRKALFIQKTLTIALEQQATPVTPPTLPPADTN